MRNYTTGGFIVTARQTLKGIYEMTDKTVITTQQKFKVLNKLFEAGFKTEKDLQSINFQNVFSIPNLTVQEMSIISELQINTKGNKLYSYLGGNNDEQNNEC